MAERATIWHRATLAFGVVALVTGGAGAAAARLETDPCLLTLAEARELGGNDTVQAGGGASTCDYLAADTTPRLTIALLDARERAGQEALARLANGAKYREKKSGKMRTWIAADQLEGWVLAGDVLASVSATGESSDKRRRKLELAVFKLTEKLR